MTKKRIAIINLILALIIALFMVGCVFAWVADDAKRSQFRFGGSSGSAYFAGGDGTSGDPFTITDQYHLYNLAWLQNTGKFGNEKYYFALDADITVPDDFWLPPIGNDIQPFIGEFNGRGHTITNLKVTTNKNNLTYCPVASDATYEFSRAVGMFGKTANAGAENKSYIYNFILDNPIVVVANEYTKYSASGNYAAGIAIGHVAGKVHSIGVKAEGVGASLKIDVATASAKYTTFNSILGELAEGSTSSTVTGGGHSGGGSDIGSTFGASLNVGQLYARLENIYDNKTSSTPSTWLPDINPNTNDGLVLAKHEKLPFMVNDSLSTYVGASAKEVYGTNNVGYLCGNQNKVYQKNRTYGDPMPVASRDQFGDTYTHTNGVIPRWLYWMTQENVAGNTYSESFGTKALTTAQYNALPDNIKNFMDSLSDTDPLESIRMSQTYQNVTQVYSGSESNGQWSPHGEISWMGKTYGEGFASVSDTDNAHKYPVVDGKGRYLNENGYKVDIYGAPDSNNNYNGYLYEVTDEDSDTRRYLAPNNTWALPIASIDADGYAKAPNGYLYDSTSHDSVAVYIDENGYKFSLTDGYYTNQMGWSGTIERADASGYAMNASGEYYDVSGNLIDADNYVYRKVGNQIYYISASDSFTENIYYVDGGYAQDENHKYYDVHGYRVGADGYAIDGNGKYIVAVGNWPFQGCTIDADGWIVNSDSSYYLDNSGNKVNAFGYDGVNASGKLMKNGSVATIPMGGWSLELTAMTGTRVSVKTGTKFTCTEGNKIHPQTGSTVAYYRYNKGVVLPNCGIWFKPAETGKIRLIMYSETAGDGFVLVKCTRADVDLDDRDANGNLRDPFKVDFSNSKAQSTITSRELAKYNLPSFVLYYFEFDVTEEDINAGNIEYWLMQYGSGGAHFVYLDLGASGEGDDDSSDIGAVDENSISAIDFIYSGVSIAQTAGSGYAVGDFIVGSTRYEATKTSIYFDQLSTALEIVYIRLHDRSDNYKMYVTSSVVTSPEEISATREQYALINTALPAS